MLFRYAFMLVLVICGLTMTTCNDKKDTVVEPVTGPYVTFKFKFDPNQARLGNLGQPVGVPAGHAAQNPSFRKFSIHYIELAADQWTALGNGEILYRATETTVGGASAIDFDKSLVVREDTVFLRVPISTIKAGTYKWIRVSAAYQNYDVVFNLKVPVFGQLIDQVGTISSFIGFNTYIHSFKPRTQTVTVNANETQGYWGFEYNLTGVPAPYSSGVQSGQAPAGATTVVNPLASTSPIPAGSCVITGQFTPSALTITGKETNDIAVTLSFSINKSFEWVDTNGNGKWDGDVTTSPATLEPVTDMGLRGLVPTFTK